MGCGIIGSDEWIHIDNLPAIDEEKLGGKVELISMLTYNVWFEHVYRKERYEVILRILEDSKADFICL